jgi:hypothetical protein
VQRQAGFLRWLTRTLLGACYPGSPFERKSTALRLLSVLLACWQQPVAAGLKARASASGPARLSREGR